jgi:hypothetical protein
MTNHHRISRRHFLQAVAAGAALSPFVAPRPGAAQTTLVRHASIGASGMGLADIQAFAKHPSFELVAVADVDLARVERVKELFPQARVYQDWRELLEKERNQLDSINVSTPDHMHAPIAMAAMREGLHVYVQKPLAATLRETRKLTEYARSRRLVTQMGIQVSSAPTQRAAEALIRAGAIGKVREVHTFCDKSWGAEGLLPAVTSPVPPTLAWDQWLGVGEDRLYQHGAYHPAEWRRRVGFGTGTLGDMGCHIVSAPFRALALHAPLTVTSFGPAPTRDNWPVQSRVRYVFRGTPLTEGDTVEFWWYDGEERPPDRVVALASDQMPKNGSVTVGTDGVLVLPHIDEPRLLPADRFSAYEMPSVEPRDHYGEFLDAVAATKAGTDRGLLVRPSANFDYSGPLTETVLLGTVAAWYPHETLEWDARGMKVRNRKDARAHVERTYRKGWKVKGL